MTGNPSEKAKALAGLQRKQAEIAAEIAALEAELAVAAPSKGPAISPFSPEEFPALPPVAGLRLSSGEAGVRYRNRHDVMLAELSAGSVMAATFTRSETRSAPVLWCQERIAALAASPAKKKLAIVVNSGNANAFTGRHGREAVETVVQTAGKVLAIPAGNVFMASTGVIGEPLPAERVTAKLQELATGLSPDGMEGAARAIMTTDTFPKGASAVADLDGVPVTISGFAKGSGMIAPDMATMLVFIFTDAAIDQAVLQAAVAELTDESFNSITVDSDTSTSDTLLVGATGKAAMMPISSREDPRYRAFHDALGGVMRDLAIQVVKDGEGASKIIAITVTGAKSDHAGPGGDGGRQIRRGGGPGQAVDQLRRYPGG
jgi:glutamate N-acetyltransferase/amino-acid N-acetyltransferase